jgi:hypothetical protein
VFGGSEKYSYLCPRYDKLKKLHTDETGFIHGSARRWHTAGRVLERFRR